MGDGEHCYLGGSLFFRFHTPTVGLGDGGGRRPSSCAILLSPGIAVWRMSGRGPRQGTPAAAKEFPHVSLLHGLGFWNYYADNPQGPPLLFHLGILIEMDAFFIFNLLSWGVCVCVCVGGVP